MQTGLENITFRFSHSGHWTYYLFICRNGKDIDSKDEAHQQVEAVALKNNFNLVDFKHGSYDRFSQEPEFYCYTFVDPNQALKAAEAIGAENAEEIFAPYVDLFNKTKISLAKRQTPLITDLEPDEDILLHLKFNDENLVDYLQLKKIDLDFEVDKSFYIKNVSIIGFLLNLENIFAINRANLVSEREWNKILLAAEKK